MFLALKLALLGSQFHLIFKSLFTCLKISKFKILLTYYLLSHGLKVLCKLIWHTSKWRWPLTLKCCCWTTHGNSEHLGKRLYCLSSDNWSCREYLWRFKKVCLFCGFCQEYLLVDAIEKENSTTELGVQEQALKTLGCRWALEARQGCRLLNCP